VRISLDGPLQDLLCYGVVRRQQALGHGPRRAT
jgi:hypothetical protein